MDPDPKKGNGNGDEVTTSEGEVSSVADAGQADVTEEVSTEDEEVGTATA